MASVDAGTDLARIEIEELQRGVVTRKIRYVGHGLAAWRAEGAARGE